MPRISSDAVIALGLLALCGVFFAELQATRSSGAFVTTTTFPKVLVGILAGLSALLLLGALRRTATAEAPSDPVDRSGTLRVFGLVGWIAVYVAALPWAGYFIATAAFMVGASLMFGNRRWGVIASWAVLLPALLLFFFEKVMIVLLPASRLLG